MIDALQAAVGDAFRIERELGGGGMSRVFLATEVALGRQVVIKVVLPEAAGPAAMARFRREAEVTAQLQHPHILPVIGVRWDAELPWIITPFVAGETLRHRLERDGPLPVDEASRLLRELGSALGYAHARGVIHRDVKPENVFLSGGHAVLADFGISSIDAGSHGGAGTGTRLTMAGTSLGTPGYMSPEQATGDDRLDGRSDLYSLGVVAFEMLAGVPPFRGESYAELVRHHLVTPPPDVTTLRPGIPTPLASAIARALAKAPADRFPDAAGLLTALDAPVSPAKPPAGRSRQAWWAVTGALCIAAAAITWARERAPSRPASVESTRIAIAPFDAIGSDATMWREGLLDLLATNLDGAGPLRTVSPTMVMRAWPKDARADRATALAVARHAGAGVVAYGSVLPGGRDSVRVRVTLLDAERDAPIGPDLTVANAAERIDLVADSLSLAIIASLNEARRLGATRRAVLGSASLPAIKAFLQGEQHYRRNAWDSAQVHYRRAIAADSTFAPAIRHLGNALGWQLGPDNAINREGYQLLLRAGQLNRGLAPRESVLVAADSVFAAIQLNSAPWTAGSDQYPLVVRLTQLMEQATTRFGDDPETWYQLGDVRFHFTRRAAPTLPNAARAREAFERAIAVDSGFAPAYNHLVELAAEDQDTPAMRRYVDRVLATSAGTPASRAMTIVRGAIAQPPLRVPLDSLLRAGQFQTIRDVVINTTPLADSTEVALRLMRDLFATVSHGPAPPEVVTTVRWGLTTLLGFRGHSGELVGIVQGDQASLLLEVALAGAIPPDSADRLMRAVVQHPPGANSLVSTLAWWAERRDTAAFEFAARQLARMSGDPLATRGMTLVPGLRALAHADTARAVATLAVPDSACSGLCTIAHFQLGRVLAVQHRDSAAAAWLERYPLTTSGLRVLWRLELARVLERLGRRREAVDAYAFVADAWQGGDPEVQPIVQEARRGLQRLRSDAPRGITPPGPARAAPRSPPPGA